ncbi:hypothetical protein GCM10010168_13800 [Actinoplanes ianthinogenes]|uniref:Uncharacterized protein n=1 Tax=Actinoplanes ianthinogenes TaxID=122358 RepID=A0ABN6CGJ5_9ACTN|nr:hypothetical protein Aiant_52240 [Actinoplanes ianthinogenes]GGQ98778.1 hypothetical protein GCM10010168_13800 [Actinoplanes ianthinogenes]
MKGDPATVPPPPVRPLPEQDGPSTGNASATTSHQAGDAPVRTWATVLIHPCSRLRSASPRGTVPSRPPDKTVYTPRATRDTLSATRVDTRTKIATSPASAPSKLAITVSFPTRPPSRQTTPEPAPMVI